MKFQVLIDNIFSFLDVLFPWQYDISMPWSQTASAINSPKCSRTFGSSNTRSRSFCNDLDSGASRSKYLLSRPRLLRENGCVYRKLDCAVTVMKAAEDSCEVMSP